MNGSRAAGGLPVYDPVEKILLFSTAFVQVNAGGLDTLVSENIGEQRNVITFFYKFFRK